MKATCTCNKEIKLVSTCCQAEVKVICSEDEISDGNNAGMTCHYRCQKCLEACDVKEVEI